MDNTKAITEAVEQMYRRHKRGALSNIAWCGEFQPGDGTKYRFLAVIDSQPGYIFGGGTQMRAYSYRHDSLFDAYDEHSDAVGPGQHGTQAWADALGDPYIGYVAEKGKCLPATAWAFVQWWVEQYRNDTEGTIK